MAREEKGREGGNRKDRRKRRDKEGGEGVQTTFVLPALGLPGLMGYSEERRSNVATRYPFDIC